MKWREERKSLSANERGVIRRMRTAIDKDSCLLLTCRDNGVGLDQARVNDLMGEGNTDKPDQGLGTSGVGHLTAFAASDLRYVLYAGRARQDGELVDVAGGHAILAPYKGGDGKKFAADGFWMRPDADLYERTRENFPAEIPSVLSPELEQLQDTGSIIAIAAFDSFRQRKGPSVAAESIADAVAVNFLVAVMTKRLTATVSVNGEATVKLDSNSINSRLSNLASKPAAQRSGRLHRKYALRSCETIRTGREINVPEVDGVTCWVRELPAGKGEYSRVQLFRDGMWITNKAPGLQASDFGDRKKFDAVVNLTSGRLHELVRTSEGPEHRGIDRHRIPDEYKELRKLTGQVANALREEVPGLGSGPVAPADFAMLPGALHAAGEVVPPYNPHAPLGEEPVTDPGGEEDPDPDPKPPNPRPGPGPGPVVPRLLTTKGATQSRTAARPLLESDGSFTEIKALISPPAKLKKDQAMRVAVRMTTGSDATADSPLPPRWQSIKSVAFGDRRVDATGLDQKFVDVPNKVRELTVRLAKPSTNAESVELVVVPARSK